MSNVGIFPLLFSILSKHIVPKEKLMFEKRNSAGDILGTLVRDKVIFAKFE